MADIPAKAATSSFSSTSTWAAEGAQVEKEKFALRVTSWQFVAFLRWTFLDLVYIDAG
jgi:hypothetical protein